MAGRSQNQTDCVNLKMNTKFPFKFIPESAKRDQAEEAVQKITNYTNYCLQKKFSNNGTRLCKKPVVTINYPLISGNPRIQLQLLPRPYLATKESSSSTSNEVLRALGQIWKLFVFCLIAAAISGVVIWFLVSISRRLRIFIPREASLKADHASFIILSAIELTTMESSFCGFTVILLLIYFSMAMDSCTRIFTVFLCMTKLFSLFRIWLSEKATITRQTKNIVIAVNSRLADISLLPTPRYYGQKLKVRENKNYWKKNLATMDFFYCGHQIVVPKVSVI